MAEAQNIAQTPEPPYYAVIFTSKRFEADAGYRETAERMVQLAAQIPGFLGVESLRGADGLGITVSYWRDEIAIKEWREQDEHAMARDRGRKLWYSDFYVRVAKVERAYGQLNT